MRLTNYKLSFGIKNLLTGLGLLLLSFTAFAKPINEHTALQVGKNFLSQTIYSDGSDLKLAAQSTSLGGTVNYYIFSGDKSFVIVSADDRATPVLGYSDESAFKSERISPDVAYLLKNYSDQISTISSKNMAATIEITHNWAELISGTKNQAKAATVISPMLKTTWDQLTYYNDLCPYDNFYNEKTVTGCVATAMAQVLKYWNYPNTGTGKYSYDQGDFGTLSATFATTRYQWTIMPNNVTTANSAVATLMYDCGVSVGMHYGTAANGGSAAYALANNGQNPVCAENALKQYFGYAKTLKGVNRSEYATSTDWINMLVNELSNKRPVIYTGAEASGAGHCFVFDGFNGTHNFFHVNWGWSGAYNGFFSFDALNPGGVGTGGGTGDFNIGQQAIIGIEPAVSQGTSGIAEEVTYSNTISLYPNPSKGIVTINLPDASVKPLLVNVTDMQGKAIYSAVPGIDAANLSLNTSTMADGMYFVTVRTDKGMYTSKMVVGK
jgi:hypothetical protein